MNFLTLSKDIKGIIKLYLLPCRKQIECNRQLVLEELYALTSWIRSDLNNPNIKRNGYMKYGNLWWCTFLKL